ncbi:MAG: hypothetical protein U0401_25730 [Anaerolineae bacterium]
MLSRIQDLSIRVKLLTVGMGGVALTVMLLVAIGIWQNNTLNVETRAEMERLTNADLDHITWRQRAYNVVQSQHELLQQQVNYNLNVVMLLEQQGPVHLSPKSQ